MTHPPAGPSTPPPPSGPRFDFRATVASYLDLDGRRARRIAAELAGVRSTHATPLPDQQRIDNYWRQNGHAKGLTPRQRRRAEHKACRNFYRLPAAV